MMTAEYVLELTNVFHSGQVSRVLNRALNNIAVKIFHLSNCAPTVHCALILSFYLAILISTLIILINNYNASWRFLNAL